MYQGFITTEEASKRRSEMESRDHSKNAAIPKSHTSRGKKYQAYNQI